MTPSWACLRRFAVEPVLAAATVLAAPSPDVLLVVIDDLGVDSLRPYATDSTVSDYPHTPNIDKLAAEGVTFRNAWSTPVCGPTRAALLTGRHGSRTGVLENNTWLPPEELTIPEVLAHSTLGPERPYAMAAFGKWHLGGGASGPNEQGFPHFAGALGNVGIRGDDRDYFDWQRTVNGKTSASSAYATTVEVDDALSWLGGRQGPYFIYLAFNAVHGPMHVPPHSLLSPATVASLPAADSGEPRPAGYLCKVHERRSCYFAMVEAFDHELGRLLRGLPRPATVLLVGDNGTPPALTPASLRRDHGKHTLYQGGINVPLIIREASGVSAGRVSEALVHAADLFSTVLDLAGARAPQDRAIDGVNLMPFVRDPALAGRAVVQVEFESSKAIRNRRFKLIRFPTHEELYDLTLDPYEQHDLLAGRCASEEASVCVPPVLDGPAAAAHAELSAALETSTHGSKR